MTKLNCPWCGSRSYNVKAWEHDYQRCKCDVCNKYFYTFDSRKTIKMFEDTDGERPDDYKGTTK